jgi:uncharacterized protein YndB with AHSA1/START domain
VIRQSVRVDLAPAEAFRLFTDGIGEWWPLREGYSYGPGRTGEIFLEPRVGGRFFERFSDGVEHLVGTVRECRPAERILFTWKSPDWRAETEVEVRFREDPAGTLVEVEHRGFDQLGPEGEKIARRWLGGWPRVLQAYADHAALTASG